MALRNMNYQISANSGFRAAVHPLSGADGITLLRLTADADAAAPLRLELRWSMPDLGTHLIWTPLRGTTRAVPPNWSSTLSESNAAHGAPVCTALDCADRNRCTVAVADGLHTVRLRMGVMEENGNFDCRVVVEIESPVAHYETDVRIDLRDVPFYRAIDDVRAWWETHDGYTPAPVPAAAEEPLYSAWYSYHQNVDVPAIVDECEYFARLGTRVLIVDDGWQTDNSARGYDYCGDWQTAPGKVPSMRAFADAVHQTGMKFMIWYSVPFVGEYSQAYDRFKDMMLGRWNPNSKTWVLDPRFPAVRAYLIDLYCRAVTDWNLDGLKLDFVDSFVQMDDRLDPRMDLTSVPEAVDRLMKDVHDALVAIKPDILLEFRQSYIGPVMRTFGNMFRSGDCPLDSFTNRIHVLDLRLLSGSTAVHSDMVMWHPDETAEQAAFQLTAVLFAVPQISVRRQALTDAQARMVADYLAFWTRYRDVLLHGEMCFHGCAANYPYVSSRLGNRQVGAVYGGQLAYLDAATDEIVVVNANMDARVLLSASFTGAYAYTVYNCLGEITASGVLELGGVTPVNGVPVNGRIVLTKAE